MYCVLPPLFVLKDVLFSLFCEMGTQLHGANRVYQPFKVNPLSGVTSSSQIAVADIANHAYGCLWLCVFFQRTRDGFVQK